MLSPEVLLRRLLDEAIASALPVRCLGAFLPSPPRGRTVVLGAGKAAAAMAAVVEQRWPAEAPLAGLVVTRYGHRPAGASGGRIEVVEAAHPVPDAAGERAARRIADLAGGLSVDDLVLCLISGGGSALLSLPAEGVSLEDKRILNQALLRSGATIAEMNCVRKHLSALKGGRLGAMCAPARVVTLVISDVPGDDPSVIASGPTVPDSTRCEDALAVLERRHIDVPPSLRAALMSGRLETPKPGDPRFAGHQLHLVATPQQALEAAAQAARSAGLQAHILSDAIEGESHVVGQVHAALARQVARRSQPFTAPCVILSGGETTVTVKGSGGRGGRATEFLLGAAIALQGEPRVWMLAADTDGIDGVEHHAGAWLGPDSWARAQAAGLQAPAHLDCNDSFGYFQALGSLIVTGPTYTNVNDFRAILVL